MRTKVVNFVNRGMLIVVAATAAAATGETADELQCAPVAGKYELQRLSDGDGLGLHETMERCEEIRLAARGGVVCAYFTPDMPVGPGGWQETGWRPRNVATGIGLGRRPVASLNECLDVTRAAAGGVVCTNTGVGAKAANIETNMWCGASSQMRYCLEATRHAVDNVVCSFPSDGTGAEAGWIRTEVTDTCDYQSSKMSLAACNASIGGG